MTDLMTIYHKQAVPSLKKEFGLSNDLAVPKIEKVVVNIGVGRLIKDEKVIELINRDLALITGQKPIPTKAKKSIASFKTRTGMVIGFKVTLRGRRMNDFLARLINIALPRTRDFRGLDAKSIDEHGNLTIGIKEHIVFPEVSAESSRNIFSFEITVVTKAKNRVQAIALYKVMGFPLRN